MSKPIFKPKIIKPKMNSQNIIMLSIFIVGCYILYRMISSVQQQVLVLKNEVVNIKLSNGRTDLEIVSKGFEVTEDADDSQSIKSLDIDVIMQKLNDNDSPLEGSVKRRSLFATIQTGQSEQPVDILPSDEPIEIVQETAVDAPIINNDETEETNTVIIDDDDDITKKTIGDLRKTLKSKGISAKGTKAELIERLSSA